MDDKQEHQRLKEIFAGLEKPITTPRRKTSKAPTAPESLIVNLEEQSLELETSAVAAEADPPSDISQVDDDEQPTDEPDLLEQITDEYDEDEDILEEDLDDSDPSSTFHELNLTNWQVVGIGTTVGILVAVLVISITYQMDLFDNLGRFVVAGAEILFGILGAFFGRISKETKLAVWIDALTWSLIPIAFRVCRLFCCSFS